MSSSVQRFLPLDEKWKDSIQQIKFPGKLLPQVVVLVNGGINLSELDGWWAEAYTPEVGWPIGDMQEHDEDSGWDAAEAEALYNLLDNKSCLHFMNVMKMELLQNGLKKCATVWRY